MDEGMFYNLSWFALIDQQVLDTVPAGLNPNDFKIAHNDSDIRVEGQMLGYSIDANNDFATVSNCTVTLCSPIIFSSWHYLGLCSTLLADDRPNWV